MLWTVTYRNIWTNGKGQQIETVHIECISGDNEGDCAVVDRDYSGEKMTNEEAAALARVQGWPIYANDIDG